VTMKSIALSSTIYSASNSHCVFEIRNHLPGVRSVMINGE
jgi:hypothetical protein